MNLSAFARSLSNSLRFGLGYKKHLDTPPTERETSSTSSTPLSLPAAPSTTSNPTVSSHSINHPIISTHSISDPTDEEELINRRLSNAVTQINQQRQPFKQTVEQILQKVSELEHTLYEDQRQEFKLRMALERETERIHELNFSLDTEKQRNERLVQLLRGIDTDSSSEGEPDSQQLMSGMRMQSKVDLYGSISPLLMQQRYDELCVSHRQTHRQLAKKEKAMKLLKCDLEELRGKYDTMYDDYRNEQRRLETLCTRYMHMQQKKKQQIFVLKETLGFASECILHAQLAIESYETGYGIDKSHLTTFNLNLEFFMRALRDCCCLRKLQELQQQQDLDVEEKNLKAAKAPSVGGGSNCVSHTQLSKRRQRKRHKH